ncbi:RICIN domain-containing protein [Streptomyces sp. NPDC007369]|uniref:RICIN domain-containing protein n=1 Tax=Streptomyces sp. NPDC007369 TaxID=3154589 RepID=UPI0033C3800C
MKRANTPMVRLNRILVAGVFGTVLGLVGTLAAPTPAAAATGTGLFQNLRTKQCLDANHDGAVYTRGCERGNLHQTWEISDRIGTARDGHGQYFIKNKATGQCLAISAYNTSQGSLFTTTK